MKEEDTTIVGGLNVKRWIGEELKEDGELLAPAPFNAYSRILDDQPRIPPPQMEILKRRFKAQLGKIWGDVSCKIVGYYWPIPHTDNQFLAVKASISSSAAFLCGSSK